jgi:predicted amidohydrolase YtcJ
VSRALRSILFLVTLMLAGCGADNKAEVSLPADLILHNARVYTFDWPAPAGADGQPAAQSPHTDGGWEPDASAVAVRGGLIVAVGGDAAMLALAGPQTRKIDLQGQTLLPGLADSHTHVFELGAKLNTVDLVDVETEAEAVALLAAAAQEQRPGQWVLGQGWDEGAWANRYPSKTLLSAAVPDHPVALKSLHGFAVWVNQTALDELGIAAETAVPVGGEMRLGTDGEPNGLFLNRATTLVNDRLPARSPAQLEDDLLKALEDMARNGYTTVHEAGTPAAHMAVLEKLEAEARLPLRFYAMLSVRDEALAKQWLERGPDTDSDSMLVTRSVKAYYDGALGSRGARLLEGYADQPQHRGISGDGYGFNQALTRALMDAGFQVGIHAIGDAGNREVLDFIEAVQRDSGRVGRHRIEHAQVLHPDDLPRLAELGVVASMEPPHAVEDKRWAEDRLGAQRIQGAYAWRSLLAQNTALTFNADNPGSDHNIFYGLHAAVTRRDKDKAPPGGWYPEQAVTMEEALRAYTSGAAFAAFREAQTGRIALGLWADLTAMDIDPLVVADTDPDGLLRGQVTMTVVGGQLRYQARSDR